jgi:hypothetical protein
MAAPPNTSRPCTGSAMPRRSCGGLLLLLVLYGVTGTPGGATGAKSAVPHRMAFMRRPAPRQPTFSGDAGRPGRAATPRLAAAGVTQSPTPSAESPPALSEHCKLWIGKGSRHAAVASSLKRIQALQPSVTDLVVSRYTYQQRLNANAQDVFVLTIIGEGLVLCCLEERFCPRPRL